MNKAEAKGLFKAKSLFLLNLQYGVPILLLAMLGLMTLPVPTFLLDVFFTFNIAIAIIVLLMSIYVLRPLDFSVFPSVLLVVTLLRLALNVASTRVVLMYGHEGGNAAGEVIKAFGEVVIGGDYAVGLIVFSILMIINFVVVTKGAGRVSEVSARFTLDAMPGKQMAIDADLNAGLIDADQAKLRRAEVASEADFYGSMDGASKFVKGDAIASLLILFINIFGGLTIGMMQHDLLFADAVEKYALLTIGDGLVAQIPSLLLSVATAIMVTRNGEKEDIGSQIASQVLTKPKALWVSSSIMFIMGIIPGMPHFVFLMLATILGSAAYWITLKNKEEDTDSATGKKQITDENGVPQDAPIEDENKELSWDDVQTVDIVGLEVGYKLIAIVDKSQGGQLLSRIKGVRKKFSQDVGFLMPSIHIRDNLELMPDHYRITLMGVTIAEAQVYPDKELAINPGQVFGSVDGIVGKDPAFGLEAIWIESKDKEKAQTLGYTVVDCSTVIATHVNKVLHQHSYELLGHEDVEHLIEQLKKSSPKLAEELIPNCVSHSLLLKVLQNLLIEDVPIKDMRSIAESITNIQPPTTDANLLTQAARQGLSRLIIQNIVGSENELPVITLEKDLEHLLLKSMQQSGNDGNLDTVMLEPMMAEKLKQSLAQAVQKQEIEGRPAVLLVPASIRMLVVRFCRHSIENIHVLSFQEIPDNKKITIVASVGQ
ncbi:MAG: flagellar biosynthesis protein FlhA [Saccharospirillaceae bacterium]|nr:flagellar biosynthesis protein FlhA [Pseudomonadales bacterium]NRB78644.1 flagellar biosynthesis protein FlhA [Saccharospirillaceae bacterium]